MSGTIRTTSAPARYARYVACPMLSCSRSGMRGTGPRRCGTRRGAGAPARVTLGARLRAVRGPPLRQPAGVRLFAIGAAGVTRATAPRSGVAWRHTITKRCTAVNAVSTSMIQSTGTRMSNARPTPRSTMRSARSMSPPRAAKPSDSARARS